MAQDDLIIYHNPRCSKSRETLGLLESRDIHPTIVKYLDTPPDAATLKNLLKMLNLSPRELIRTKESEYKDNNLDDPSLSDEALIEAMVATPKLIERPIVVHNGKATIGRPPVKVLEIL